MALLSENLDEVSGAMLTTKILAPSSRPVLSRRQQEILLAASLGTPDKLIAEKLRVSTRTLEGHWRAIHRELGSMNRCQAGFLFALLRENTHGKTAA